MFQFSLPITVDSITSIKRRLHRKLPEVKSSHRCEAMARGLGFRTHAALLETARVQRSFQVTVDGASFSDYLARHDFTVAGSDLYRAAGGLALENVGLRCPTLTRIGFGIGEWERGDTPAGRRARFDDYRADLFSDHSVEAFIASLAFVSRVKSTRTIRPMTSSYWLKHLAENQVSHYPHGEELGPVYVPNGVLIAAAIHCGFAFTCHRDDYGREMLNANFSMSRASLVDLECEIRPNCGQAQDRRRRQERRRANRIGLGYFT